MEKICLNCSKVFDSTNKRFKYCSSKCRIDYNSKLRAIKKLETRESIKCLWCNKDVIRVYGIHIKNHHKGKTVSDYIKDFPNALLTSKDDFKNTSKNSGLHMKTDKYKKMFSDKMLGLNNPNHTSNTTDQERKERSPFSKEFYKLKGYLDEAEIESIISKFAKESIEGRLTESNYEYWLNKTNGDTLEAKQLYKERQTTFSKEICIAKFGKEKGLEVWKQRQEKWIKNFKKNNYSKVSQEVFKKLYESEELLNLRDNIYFAILDKDTNTYNETGLKNFEYRLTLNDKWILPDFYISGLNKIIEFDGGYWHNRPETIEKDSARETSILESGYEVFHIKELDWRDNPDKIIQDCLKYIIK